MRLPGLSIRGLMAFVLVASMGLVALRFSTPIVAGNVILMTLFGLGLAILAAVNRRDARRAFWIGFALMGWGYVWFSSPSWTLTDAELDHREANEFGGESVTPHQEPILAHWLPTTALLDALNPSLQASSGSSGSLNRVASLLGITNSRLKAINAALDRPLRMPFAQPTPFEDVLKHIRTCTRSKELPEGIPFYIDPVSLEEAEKTMASPISLDLDDVSLRKSLKLLFSQLDLTYTVDEELITVKFRGSRQGPYNSEAAQSFRRVGHCLFALVFALIGGFAGRALYATRPAGAGRIGDAAEIGESRIVN
jgi:hypothetical protein